MGPVECSNDGRISSRDRPRSRCGYALGNPVKRGNSRALAQPDAPWTQRIHLLGRRCKAAKDPPTPHRAHPRRATRRKEATLLLGGVHSPHRQRTKSVAASRSHRQKEGRLTIDDQPSDDSSARHMRRPQPTSFRTFVNESLDAKSSLAGSSILRLVTIACSGCVGPSSVFNR